MKGFSRALSLAFLTLIMATQPVEAADIDRTAVDFQTPSEIKWVRNKAGTNESVVLFGDPSKPGPYVSRIKWAVGQYEPTALSSQ